MAKTEGEAYDGPVVYMDGWHWSVTTDVADRDRRLSHAKSELAHAKRRSDTKAVKTAQANLDEIHKHDHHVPGVRLYAEVSDDGESLTYRVAGDDDESWHDRFHGRFATISLEGGQPGLTVTADEFESVKRFLESEREGK